VQGLPFSAGVLPVDKPAGIGSYDVIRELTPFFPGLRLGHTGTLDPAASGLLLVCVGTATRLVSYFHEMPKTYMAEILLGTVTETEDLYGKVVETHPVPDITSDNLEAIYARFTGEIMQRPPAYSALKVGGVRAYTLARKGEVPELAERRVHIYAITPRRLYQGGDRLYLDIRCSSGTYIRSLARDIGEALGCGACLSGLRRISIGDYMVEDAYFYSNRNPQEMRERYLDIAACLGQERLVTVAGEEARLLSHGIIPRAIAARLENCSTNYVGFMDAARHIPAVLRRENGVWRFVCTQSLPVESA
jgi:tRNA pseudouridine55 synthase